MNILAAAAIEVIRNLTSLLHITHLSGEVENKEHTYDDQISLEANLFLHL